MLSGPNVREALTLSTSWLSALPTLGFSFMCLLPFNARTTTQKWATRRSNARTRINCERHIWTMRNSVWKGNDFCSCTVFILLRDYMTFQLRKSTNSIKTLRSCWASRYLICRPVTYFIFMENAKCDKNKHALSFVRFHIRWTWTLAPDDVGITPISPFVYHRRFELMGKRRSKLFLLV